MELATRLMVEVSNHQWVSVTRLAAVCCGLGSKLTVSESGRTVGCGHHSRTRRGSRDRELVGVAGFSTETPNLVGVLVGAWVARVWGMGGSDRLLRG